MSKRLQIVLSEPIEDATDPADHWHRQGHTVIALAWRGRDQVKLVSVPLQPHVFLLDSLLVPRFRRDP